MTTPTRLITALLTLFTLPAVAGDFAGVVPANHLVYVEIQDLPGLTARVKNTPLGEAYRSFEWKEAILLLVEMARTDQDAPDLSEVTDEDILKVIDRISNGWKTVAGHMDGDWAMSLGSFQEVIDVFQKNEALREELLPADDDEILDDEDPDFLEQLAQEEALDAAEAASILGQVSFFADVRDGEDLEATLAGWIEELRPHLADSEGGMRYRTVTRDDVTLHHLGVPGPEDVPSFGLHWAIHDGVWITAFTEDTLQESLKRRKHPPARSLAASPKFQESLRFLGEHDSLFYMDLGLLDRLVRQAVDAAGPLPETGSFTAEKMLDWLDLSALLPIAQGSRLEEGGMRTLARMGFSRESGLSRLLMDSDVSPAPTPGFVHRDVGQFGSLRWNIGGAWTRMETEMMSLSPEVAAGLGMGRMFLTGQLGFDLKLQFLDHLDSGLVFIQSLDPDVMIELSEAMQSGDTTAMLEASAEHPTGGSNYLIGIELKNKAAIEEAMGRLMNRFFPMGVPEPETIGGIEILNPIPKDAAGGMIEDLLLMAFLEDWLVLSIGDPTLLEQAIEAHQNEALQIWNDPEYQALRSRLPETAHTLEYSSGEQQENALRMSMASLEMMKGETDAPIPDLSAMSAFIHKALGTSTRDGLVVKAESFLDFR